MSKTKISTDDCFIAIYTHSSKQYCDKQFFKALFKSNIGNALVSIIDNSIGTDYFNRLNLILHPFHKNIKINHIDISRDDPKHQFLINVEQSVNELRRQFLQTDKKYFITLESDVIPRDKNWLSYFLEKAGYADILGGLYHAGFHSNDLWDKEDEIVYTRHVLSGCTLYKRELLKVFSFRWSMKDEGAFPDAWICYDAITSLKNKWRIANYTKIKCDHLTNASGGRGHDKID